MDFFVVVKLVFSQKRAVIPASWIQDIDEVKIFNGAVHKYQKVKIFVSNDMEKTPNFELPVSDDCTDDDVCRNAILLKPFGKYICYCS